MSIKEFNINITMPTPLAYIYRISNRVSQKSYIGQTKDLERRITQHLSGEGSPLLLVDLVKQGISEFDFECLQVIYVDTPGNVLDAEDRCIEEHNSLSPFGYNKCLNRTITIESDVESPHDDITITGKFIRSTPVYHVFTIGELSQSRAYQTLINLKGSIDSNMLIKRKKGKFSYFELRVESDAEYVKGKDYDLCLFYEECSDTFTC